MKVLLLVAAVVVISGGVGAIDSHGQNLALADGIAELKNTHHVSIKQMRKLKKKDKKKDGLLEAWRDFCSFDGLSPFFEREIAKWPQSAVDLLNSSNFADAAEPGNLARLDYDFDEQTFGVRGEFTQYTRRVLTEFEKFWEAEEMNFDSLRVRGVHGTFFESTEELTALAKLVFMLSQPEAEALVEQIQKEVRGLPDGSNNLLLSTTFTFVAAPIFVPEEVFEPTILIGDGAIFFNIEDFPRDPCYRVRHTITNRLGYYVAYAIGRYPFSPDYVPQPGLPRGRPYTKEEATDLHILVDVFTAYYSAHKKGRNFSRCELCVVQEVAFRRGCCKCVFQSTNGQSLCASIWGIRLAKKSGKKKMSAFTIAKKVYKVIEKIRNVDKSVCPTPKCGFIKEQFGARNITAKRCTAGPQFDLDAEDACVKK